MCLAVPGQVIEIYQENGLPMGRIDYAGVVGAACLAYTPEAVEGSWVIVHAGFALQVLDEAEAAASLATLSELNELIEADSLPDVDDDADREGKLP
jgi:hydrogenase expression/formation protein HypC